MTSYRINRGDTDSTVFDGREDFLEDVVKDTGAPLCRAMAKAVMDRRGMGGDDVDEDDDVRTGYWNGMPWLTPVLGSGCLLSPAERGLTPAALAAGVAARLRGIGPPPPAGSEAWETIGARFTLSLAERGLTERARLAPPDETPTEAAVTVDGVTARLVLIAALATRFCHAARAMDPAAIGRWSDEVVSLRRDRPLLDDPYDLAATVVAPLRLLLSDVISETTARPRARGPATELPGAVLKAITALAESLRAGLRDDRPAYEVSLNAVRLATEAAWYLLASSPDSYYGWTELLLGLILREPNPKDASYRRKRPRFDDLGKIRELVGALFEAPTRTRWTELESAPARSGTGASVHRAVAAVLDAQSRARPPANLEWGPGSLPLPVAFSTSFDLELEMELWARGRSFSVALPVHVARDRDSQEVELCWLLGDVDHDPGVAGDQALDRLREPTKWRVLADAEMNPSRPVIVRLTGCPLYHLRSLRGDGEARGLLQRELKRVQLQVGNRFVVHPAVTVDEYLALRQSEVELLWATNRSDDSRNRRSRGFSSRLTSDGIVGQLGNRRYWMALGVPISDPALRHRVMSPLTARWIGETSRTEPGQPDDGDPNGARAQIAAVFSPGQGDIAAAASSAADGEDATPDPMTLGPTLRESLVGVAVNTRMDEDEAFLLSWLGLSVVRGEVADFVPDLLDYRDHLRSEGEERQLRATCCTVQEGI